MWYLGQVSLHSLACKQGAHFLGFSSPIDTLSEGNGADEG